MIMSALEQEIIEKFQQLQPAAKRRVRAVIDQAESADSDAVSTSEFDYAAWFHTVEILRDEIHSSRGQTKTPNDVVGLLRDIRDGEDD